MRLDLFDNSTFDRGCPRWVEGLWLVAQALFVSSWIPGSVHRVWLLRRFGASIGEGVVIRPRARVKFPWRLTVGDHVWIGEAAWIDNLADVTIGHHVCISQGAYLCTGSHDWTSPHFDLVTGSIEIHSHAWIGARSVVGPGVTIEEGAVLALHSTATSDLTPWSIHLGTPATALRKRVMSTGRSPQ